MYFLQGEKTQEAIAGAVATEEETQKKTSLLSQSFGDQSRATTPTQVWAGDFYRSPMCSFDRSQAFFVIELHSRKMNHVGVTRSPTNDRVPQQLREATPYGQAPKYLIRDHDSKFGSCFARVATTSAIELLKTPVHAPRDNAVCERFAQECPARMSGPRTDPP